MPTQMVENLENRRKIRTLMESAQARYRKHYLKSERKVESMQDLGRIKLFMKYLIRASRY